MNLNFEGGVTVSIVSGTVSFSALTEAVWDTVISSSNLFCFPKKSSSLRCEAILKFTQISFKLKTQLTVTRVDEANVFTCLHPGHANSYTRLYTAPLYCCVAILFVCTWNAWNPLENLTTRLVVHSRVYHIRWCTPHVHTYIVYMCTVPALLRLYRRYAFCTVL